MSVQTSAQSEHEGLLAQFDRTTSIWGPITLALGLLVSLAAALYAAFGLGLGVSPSELWTAVAVVLATFGVIAIVEPISYYPILGRSASYQAFMIGNISNKLLPSAIIAQTNLGERPGTRRAELIAGSAIIGAVLVHLTTLTLLVGILGTVLVGVLPTRVVMVARLYILPSVFGAVIIQAIVTMKTLRTTIIAAVVAALVVFVLNPLVPGLTNYLTVIAVVVSIFAAWFGRKRS
jgi:hypothetical protein